MKSEKTYTVKLSFNEMHIILQSIDEYIQNNSGRNVKAPSIDTGENRTFIYEATREKRNK